MTRPANGEGGASFQQVHDEPHAEDRPSVGIEQLVQQLKETADKLVRDGANRGDVKLLSTALKELRYAFKVFAPYRRRRKVTIFGSARLSASDPAYQQAVVFSRMAVEAGFMVITGAASGIMEAGHVGAGRENSIGVNILLPFEQEANSIIAGDLKLMHLKYFFTRKLLFVKESDAVALFPGGFGTLDEGFEVLTLIQTGKSHLFPIVLVDAPGGDYWLPWQRYIEDVLMARDLISPADTALYKITDSA
ncbi:MAG TPA: LOG family protein, partial [Gemmataceae bacterium]|nr:LOG family protein [Gemmataceae bacterium]